MYNMCNDVSAESVVCTLKISSLYCRVCGKTALNFVIVLKKIMSVCVKCVFVREVHIRILDPL